MNHVCESRHNHRHAVVVQDLATQWIQSYPWKTKTSQETEKSLQKFLEPTRKPKVIYTDYSTPYERRFGVPFNGPVIPCGTMVEYHPISENIHLNAGQRRPRRGTRNSSRRIKRVFFQPTSTIIKEDDSTLDDAEARNDFWSVFWDFVYRHHVEPRVKLCVPREESFPVPLKYIDVTRTTDTSLDEMLEKISMTIGTLMEIENCQMCGQVSQDSLYWLKNHWMDFHCLGGDWQENKWPPGQTLCGPRFGKTCPMRRDAKKSKNGLSRNQSSTTPGDSVVFTSLILMLRNSKTPWRMRFESWKFRCQPQCLANFNVRSTGKLVALKPVNLFGSAWKDLLARIITIWYTQLFLCPKQWKYQM